jgi:TolA-binding protein
MQQTTPQQEDILVWFLKVWSQIEANYIRILTGFGIAIVAALIVLFFYRGQTQRAEAARAALGDVYIALYEGRVEEAIASSQEVMETYAGQAEAGEALMALANLHYEEGRIAEARTLFQQYLNEYPAEGPLGYGAWAGLASCLESEGKFAEAGQQFAAFAEAQPKSPFAPIALKEAGRCYELGTMPQQASDAYQKIVKEYDESSVARFARGQLNMMGVETD